MGADIVAYDIYQAWDLIAKVQKFGRIPDIDSGDAGEDVWDGEGAYSWPSVAAAMTISSSSANDTSDGTGARTVRVMGIDDDEDWEEVSVDLTLSGQTPVAITPDLLRVFRGFVLTAGSVGTNDGDIWIGSGTVTSGVPANKYAGILSGNGQTLMAVYTIPVIMSNSASNKGAKIIRWYATCGASQAAYATVALQSRSFGGAWRTRRVSGIGEGGWMVDNIAWGIDIDTKTDIRVRVLSNGVNNSSIEAGFDIALDQ